jgi:hypothetical protein
MAAEGHCVFDGSTLHITAWPRACGYLGRHLLRREIVETTLQSCGSRPAFETRPKSSRSRRPLCRRQPLLRILHVSSKVFPAHGKRLLPPVRFLPQEIERQKTNRVWRQSCAPS